MTSTAWPRLTYPEHRDTIETLQLWTQIVGKVRLAQTPWLNHSWHVPLYVTARGLGTGTIPHGGRAFELEFDFVRHALQVRVSTGEERSLALEPRSVADLFGELMETLRALELPVTVDVLPNEVAEPIRFPDDTTHASYDPEYAHALWQALLQMDRVFREFRTGFLGKASPVHFFWGSFDLAVTRFSGRTAPLHPGGVPHLSDHVAREAYSHEVSSAGFWPGGNGVDEPMLYSYAYPAPEGFSDRAVEPAAASFHAQLGEFVLPYEAVRSSSDPDAALLAFLESTYAAAADAADWDRVALECDLGRPGVPRPLE